MSSDLLLHVIKLKTKYIFGIEYFSETCCHTISRKLHGASIAPILRVRTSSKCVLFVAGKLNLLMCCGLVFTPSSVNICQLVHYKLGHIERTWYLKFIFPCKIKINGLKILYHWWPGVKRLEKHISPKYEEHIEMFSYLQ